MSSAWRWRLLVAQLACVAAVGSVLGTSALSQDAGVGTPSELPAPRILGESPGPARPPLPPALPGNVPSPADTPGSYATITAPGAALPYPPQSAMATAQAGGLPTPPVPSPSRWLRCKCCLQSWFLGFPEYFHEVPLGASLYAQGRTMTANGEAALMVFYNYDFIDGQPQLNLRGLDHLAQIAPLLCTNPASIVIERLPCAPDLAAARRMAVLLALKESHHPVSPERVVVGKPFDQGLSGPQAELIYRTQIFQILSASSRPTLGFGANGAGFGTGFGGLGGAGFGGFGGGFGGFGGGFGGLGFR